MFTFTKLFSQSYLIRGSQIRCAQNWYSTVQTDLTYPLCSCLILFSRGFLVVFWNYTLLLSRFYGNCECLINEAKHICFLPMTYYLVLSKFANEVSDLWTKTSGLFNNLPNSPHLVTFVKSKELQRNCATWNCIQYYSHYSRC